MQEAWFDEAEQRFKLSIDDPATKDPSTCLARGCSQPRYGRGRFCNRHKCGLWSLNNPLSRRYISKKADAKRRGIPFKLSFQQFAELALRGGLLDGDNHLDRRDPRKGYQVDNVRVVPASWNLRKASWDKMVLNGKIDPDSDHDDLCPF